MRIVIDTNVLVSGLLWHGAPHTLLERVRNDAATLITSPVLIAELDDVLQRHKFAAALQSTNTTRERVIVEIRVLAEIVEPAHCRNRFAAIPTMITSSLAHSPQALTSSFPATMIFSISTSTKASPF